MDIKSLVVNAQKFLAPDEYIVFRKQVNEIYLQSQLSALYNDMPLSSEPEPWRVEQIAKINQQLASL